MVLLQIGLFGYRTYCPIDYKEHWWTMWIAIFNVVLLVLMLTKTFFYLKIYDSFSVIVNMISSILGELFPFLLIFMLFTSFFALSYFVLRGEYEDIAPETLGQMHYAFAAFFNSYEMST